MVGLQNLDKPSVIGSFRGEVASNMLRAICSEGTAVGGAIREVDALTNTSIKAFAQRLCLGHAHMRPMSWNCDVQVLGRIVRPEDLMNANNYDFLVTEPETQPHIPEARRFMEADEGQSFILTARSSVGLSTAQILANLATAGTDFGKNTNACFQGNGAC